MAGSPPPPLQKVAVFCGSSRGVRPVYMQSAQELVRLLPSSHTWPLLSAAAPPQRSSLPIDHIHPPPHALQGTFMANQGVGLVYGTCVLACKRAPFRPSLACSCPGTQLMMMSGCPWVSHLVLPACLPAHATPTDVQNARPSTKPHRWRQRGADGGSGQGGRLWGCGVCTEGCGRASAWHALALHTLHTAHIPSTTHRCTRAGRMCTVGAPVRPGKLQSTQSTGCGLPTLLHPSTLTCEPRRDHQGPSTTRGGFCTGLSSIQFEVCLHLCRPPHATLLLTTTRSCRERSLGDSRS